MSRQARTTRGVIRSIVHADGFIFAGDVSVHGHHC